MFESVNFETKQGKRNDKGLKLFALTTCGFCKKAKTFLDENDFSYDYLYMDKIDPDTKKELKTQFAENFDKRLTYPTLMINDTELLTGFIRIAWEKELLE
jgi:glutaredoxin-like protein NrdH